METDEPPWRRRRRSSKRLVLHSKKCLIFTVWCEFIKPKMILFNIKKRKRNGLSWTHVFVLGTFPPWSRFCGCWVLKEFMVFLQQQQSPHLTRLGWYIKHSDNNPNPPSSHGCLYVLDIYIRLTKIWEPHNILNMNKRGSLIYPLVLVCAISRNLFSSLHMHTEPNRPNLCDSL